MPIHPTAVINAVGLSESVLSHGYPGGADALKPYVRLRPGLPAVTTTAQTTMLTGVLPHRHGIVGNGFYHRDLAEVRFWDRSAHLVQSERVWVTARRRDPSISVLNLFWWYNTYSGCESVVQVRPRYKADGRKVPDLWTEPISLRDDLQEELGVFPLFRFWGPAADLSSSRWIVDATLKLHAQQSPGLTLVYLPHLDYALQKFGPASEQAATAAAELAGQIRRLTDYFNERGVRVMILSEYGIEPAKGAVMLNQALREAGAIIVRDEGGDEIFDAGASEAFAVCDHQVAHVYVRDETQVSHYAELLRALPGVSRLLDGEAQARIGLNHPRSGELVLVADEGFWFAYDYWLDEAKAPDFARTVEIHRKPGYDPRELYVDPKLRWPKARIAWKLLRKKLGFRTLMDVVPLEAGLVKGTHGRDDVRAERWPLLAMPEGSEVPDEAVEAGLPQTAVHEAILSCLFDERPRLGPGQAGA